MPTSSPALETDSRAHVGRRSVPNPVSKGISRHLIFLATETIQNHAANVDLDAMPLADQISLLENIGTAVLYLQQLKSNLHAALKPGIAR